jgi:V/A-type H+-transporting ATPase subunit I
MLVEMRRVDLVIPRSAVSPALRAVHRAGLLHLVPFETPPRVGPAAFAPEGSVAAEARFRRGLERVGELAGLVTSPTVPGRLLTELWDLPDDRLLARVDALAPIAREVAHLTGERVRLSAEIARLRGYRQIVEGLRDVVGRLPAVRGFAATGIVISSRYRAIMPMLSDELDAITGGRCEVVSGDLGPDRVAAILIYPARVSGEVASLLGGRDLEEVTLPPSLAGVPFDELGPRLAADEDRLAEVLAGTETSLDALASEHGQVLAGLRLVLEDRLAETRALSEAGSSDHLIVLSGWVPADRLDELRLALERVAGPDVLVVERDVGERRPAEAPVAMANAGIVRPFEPLASFVAVPRYGSLDPTPALAITLPAFIGLMVGDAGYGLVLLAILLVARWRWGDRPVMRTIWPVGLAAAASTIAFGILFGEWFGATGRHLFGLEPIWFDRREGVVELLILALAIGVAQVTLGLVLGIVNGMLIHERREVVSRAAMLVSLAATLVLLGVAARILPDEVALIAGAALVLGIVLVVLTVGIAGPVEMIGVFGNVLSYARLMAIGLAGVMLAVVADKLGGAIPNLVLGALVAGLFHALNIGLGFFDASIQGIRLHYVEFFTKFVEPGGTPYEPFASALGTGSRVAAQPGGG